MNTSEVFDSIVLCFIIALTIVVLYTMIKGYIGIASNSKKDKENELAYKKYILGEDENGDKR